MLIETNRKFGNSTQFSLIAADKKKQSADTVEDDNNQSCNESTCSETSEYIRCPKFLTEISWPPRGKIATVMTWALLVSIIWGVLYSIIGLEALPGGNIFSILTLLLLAQLGGILTSKMHLPPLLGMLLVGIALRSSPGLDIIGTAIDSKWSSTLRKIALVVILTRAGMGLDPKALKQLSFMVIRLGILPNLVEMTAVSLVAHVLLGFPWLWSFLLGFILSGVSPSVVVPCMLSLSDHQLGTDKGVPTLVIAGLSIDNVLSITGFGVLLGLIFSDGSVMWLASKGPIELAAGLSYGMFFGAVCWILPNRYSKSVTSLRLIILLGANLLAIFGSNKIGFGGAGPLACLSTSFIAAIGWRNQGWSDEKNPVKKQLNLVWKFFLPLLFGLIGKEINVSVLDGDTVTFGLVTIFIGLTFRIIVSYFAVACGDLNLKERIFVALSWMPKATVQAAVGSTAYDIARSLNDNSESITLEEQFGKKVLTIAVLAIIVTAPIGAAIISLSAPKMLKKKTNMGNVVEIEIA